MTDSSEMVERAAKAICEWNGKTSWAEALEGPPFALSADHYRIMARAAFTAIREPSDEMMVAAEHAAPVLACFDDKEESPAFKAWQAMIDAALATGGDQQ